jgi:type VII secretion integral membrane protein EccD
LEEQTQHRTTTAGRLRFVLADQSTDVSLPAEVPLADLLPAVLPTFGAEWIEQGADHEGWVAQRLGEAPLDEDRTIAELGLLDGETIFLRPRADQLAPIDYDDIVDGVGEQVRTHPGSWNADRTRFMLRAGAAVCLLLGMPVLLEGIPLVVATSVAAFVTVALLGASALVARGSANVQLATLLAGVATAYAALTGAMLAVLLDPLATGMIMLAAASAAALVALTFGLVAVADSALLFAGAVLFFLLMGLTGLIGSVTPANPGEAAGIGLTVSLIVGIFVPSAAFRMSGLMLPLLPTSASELTDDIEPVPARLVVDRGVATVGYSNALHIGVGAAQALLFPVLITTGDVWMMVLSLVMALLLFLRARHPDGRVQRWAILVPAGVAIAANVMVFALALKPLARLLAAWFPAVAVGVGLVICGEKLPGRRLRPYWGRAVDILETLSSVAVLPILLQVLNVYATMRGLSG